MSLEITKILCRKTGNSEGLFEQSIALCNTSSNLALHPFGKSMLLTQTEISGWVWYMIKI